MGGLEYEELQHISKIIKILKSDEDRMMIIYLLEKVSLLSGWKERALEALKLREKS